MHSRHIIASAVTAVLLSLAAPAWCDDTGVITGDTSTGYIYKFSDDVLAAGGLNAADPRLRVVRHAARDVLIRPRLSFVPQLLKSVENL
jgi:hypothetical protein